MSSTTAVARTSIDLVTRVKSNGSTYTANSSEKVTKVSSNVTRQGEFGYPNGHLGRLTREQEDSLAEFRKILAVEGLYVAGTEGSRPSHTDSVLLRFLRARRFVPPDALEQFKTTEKWRKLNELDNLYLNIDVDDFEESKRHVSQQRRQKGNV